MKEYFCSLLFYFRNRMIYKFYLYNNAFYLKALQIDKIEGKSEIINILLINSLI